MKKILVTVAAAALLCAPVASAASARRLAKPRLALLPLPQSALGAVGASLQLQWQDFGPLDNLDAASTANGNVSPKQLRKLGRVLGYVLDYGDPYTGGAGVNEIRTSVEQYKTAADAAKGLAFWRKDGAKASVLDAGTFTRTLAKLKPRKVGQGTFAYLITKHASNLSPIYFVDERAVQGRYVLEVTIGAGNESAAKQLAGALARKLDARVRKAVAGRLHGSPVEMPFPPDSGPPPGGPDLSKLVVQPSDVGQSQIQNLNQGYGSSPYAISDYSMFLSPAGPYDVLFQDLAWYPTTTEATEVEAYSGFFGGDLEIFSTGKLTITHQPVDVSSVGDNATAENVEIDDAGGIGFDFGFVTLRKAQLVDSLTVPSPGQGDITPAALQNLAKAMAARLDAGFPG